MKRMGSDSVIPLRAIHGPESRSLTPLFLRSPKRAREVLDQITGMLEADREPHGSRRDAGGRERSIVHAEVRRRRRMDHERFRVADVGEMREERERLDELASRVA